jgi:hypothetical protein
MANVFISHAGEDSLIAFQLSEGLAQHGFTSWLFERDTIPGPSYVVQYKVAVSSSDVFLFLISRHVFDSDDIGQELAVAAINHRPIVPVLLDLAFEEFDERRPDWSYIIGQCASVELRHGECASVVERLKQSLDFWGIAPANPLRSESPESLTHFRPRRAWSSDAGQIEIEELDRVLYRTKAIDDFLAARNKYFLCANKGLGKTLLLTCKRTALMRETVREGLKSSEFIPVGRPYLDFMTDLPSLSVNHQRLLESLESCKRLWGLAIRVAVISHQPGISNDQHFPDLDRFPGVVAEWLRGEKVEPTAVFREVLGYSVGDIQRLIDHTRNWLERRFRAVHSGTYLFIDKVDQALRETSTEAWIHCQAGLVEAAWDAMNANPHVRCFVSIRQEAFFNYESHIKSNLYGATTIIRYGTADLQGMLDRLCRHYERCDGFRDMVKLNVVRDSKRMVLEDSFEFLRRHTLGRPRDFVLVAGELSSRRNELSEPEFRRVVTESAREVMVNVFHEMRPFLKCLYDRSDRRAFFELIPRNLLTSEDIVHLRLRFNKIHEGVGDIAVDSIDKHLGLHDPFEDLHRVGLLGIVVRDPHETKSLQSFLQPDNTVDLDAGLPPSPFYMVHPSLTDDIRRFRRPHPYHVFRNLPVGHDVVWHDFAPTMYHAERAVTSISQHWLRDQVDVLLAAIAAAMEAGRFEQLAVSGTSVAWSNVLEYLDKGGYDDAYLWLEELAKLASHGDRRH